MATLYLFALIVGGGLLLFSLLGDHGHHGDVSHDLHAENAFQFLSLRTLTYFLFVFGGIGAVLNWAGAPFLLVLVLAVIAGLGIASVAAASFAYLRRTDSGARDSEDSFVGLPGRVTLPIGSGGIGKVVVHRGDREYELLARPYDASAARGSPEWTSVVVVDMQRGTALVAPLDPALQNDNS